MEFEVQRWEGDDAADEAALRAAMEREGYSVFAWSDVAGATYEPHVHDHDESIWICAGEMTFGVDGAEFSLRAGDRLMLPAGTVHTAVAGSDGAAYLVGQLRRA